MTAVFRGFLIACLGCLQTIALCQAQGAAQEHPDCDKRLAQKKADWAKTKHDWLASVFHVENLDIETTWCRIGEAQGYDRVHKTEDFGRALFTGDGIHPSVGSIVPGSGLAGGLQLNLARASSSPPVRYSGNIESRGSINGFWVAGGKFEILGSGNRTDNRHIDFVLSTIHSNLPELTYFGLGNFTSVANESVYGLQSTNTKASVVIPLPKSFSFAADAQGLWTSPQPLHRSQFPSIETAFTPANTPGINVPTTYFVTGGGFGWQYPLEERLRGYRTSVATALHAFHETSGAPFSFRQFDVGWDQAYTPDLNIDVGTISLVSRLITSVAPAGNNVPFYLQPTIGGTNINNQDILRSYRDYRFRAPDALAFQTEYERAIRDPFGILLFYDVGKVALRRSDLDISHMRSSFGVGALVRAGGSPVFKIYYAFGGREGTHTNYTGNTNNFAGTGASTGVF